MLLGVRLEPQDAEPPVPYFACWAGSFDNGSPPWMIPMAMTRWNAVPSYAPSRTLVMK